MLNFDSTTVLCQPDDRQHDCLPFCPFLFFSPETTVLVSSRWETTTFSKKEEFVEEI